MRINRSLPVVLLCFIIISCGDSSSEPGYEPDGKSVVLGTDAAAENTGTLTAEDFIDPEEESYKPKIPIPREDQLIGVQTANLDLDPAEEQVLILKERNSADAFVRIVIVDYDEAWDTYRASWETETNAVNIRTFSIHFADVVGDHNLELICRGMTFEGQQSLNIYRKAKAPDGIRLAYTEICGITTEGSVEIVELSRNRAYSEQQKNGVSFPIVTLIRDPDSGNIMDLVRHTYNWKFQTNQYEIVTEEKIPGKEIEESQLKELFRKDEKAFVTFLEGPWYRTEDTEGFGAILHFEPNLNRISFLTGDIQEVYIWSNSHKILSDRLLIRAVNELVVYMGKDLSVQVLSLDSILVRESDTWRGTYSRLTPDLQQTMAEANRAPTGAPDTIPVLSGRYIGNSGDEIYFDYPAFTLVENGVQRKGGYSLFAAGLNVLELKFLENTGLVSESRTYGVEYTEDPGEGKIIRTVYLTPGVVTVYGFKPVDEAVLRFEQIESIEQDSEADDG